MATTYNLPTDETLATIADAIKGISVSGSYELPAATRDGLGGVKVGSGLDVSDDGTLSNAYSYSLPKASASALGGIKVGTGLAISSDGTLSVSYSEASNGAGGTTATIGG